MKTISCFPRLAMAFGLVLATTQIANGQAPLQKVTLATAGDGMIYAIAYLGARAGFFTQEGLQLEMVNVNSGPRQVAAVMGGSAELGAIGVGPLIRAVSKGSELVAISTFFDALDPQVVISTEAVRKLGIVDGMSLDEKVKRIRGIRLGITSPGSTTDALIRSLLKVRGIDPDQVLRLQPLGGGSNMLAALENGATDGFVWGAPQSEIARSKGIAKIIVNPLKGEVPELRGVPYIVLATSRATLAAKAELINRTVRVFTKAMKFAEEQPDQARRYLREQFPDMDDATFTGAWPDYRLGLPKTPLISESQITKTADWMNITEPIPLRPSYSSVVAPEPAQAAIRQLSVK